MLRQDIEQGWQVEHPDNGLRGEVRPTLPPGPEGGRYPRATSDIVALLVLQHQADVQNQITRLSWDTRTALAAAAAGRLEPSEAQARTEIG